MCSVSRNRKPSSDDRPALFNSARPDSNDSERKHAIGGQMWQLEHVACCESSLRKRAWQAALSRWAMHVLVLNSVPAASARLTSPRRRAAFCVQMPTRPSLRTPGHPATSLHQQANGKCPAACRPSEELSGSMSSHSVYVPCIPGSDVSVLQVSIEPPTECRETSCG